jgi:hypothetical protein
MDRGINEDDYPYFIMEYIQGIDLKPEMKICEFPTPKVRNPYSSAKSTFLRPREQRYSPRYKARQHPH